VGGSKVGDVGLETFHLIVDLVECGAEAVNAGLQVDVLGINIGDHCEDGVLEDGVSMVRSVVAEVEHGRICTMSFLKPFMATIMCSAVIMFFSKESSTATERP